MLISNKFLKKAKNTLRFFRSWKFSLQVGSETAAGVNDQQPVRGDRRRPVKNPCKRYHQTYACCLQSSLLFSFFFPSLVCLVASDGSTVGPSLVWPLCCGSDVSRFPDLLLNCWTPALQSWSRSVFFFIIIIIIFFFFFSFRFLLQIFLSL